jgi:hypothetical protein
MPVARKGLLENQRPRFKHQVYRCADAGDLSVAELTELPGLQGGERRSADLGLRGEHLKREAPCTPPLRDKDADSMQVHDSSILDSSSRVQYTGLDPRDVHGVCGRSSFVEVTPEPAERYRIRGCQPADRRWMAPTSSITALSLASSITNTFRLSIARVMATSMALYAIAVGVQERALENKVGKRAQAAMVSMLATAPSTKFADLPFTSLLLISAMGGATRAVLEAGSSPRMVRLLRKQLVLLCRGFLMSVAAPA